MIYFPLTALLLYIGFGVLMLLFGPIEYVDLQKGPVLFYVGLFAILFSGGYLYGVKKSRSTSSSIVVISPESMFLRVHQWVIVSLIATAIVQLTLLTHAIVIEGINLSPLEMGRAYLSQYDGYIRGAGEIRPIFLLQSIAYPLYLASISLGTFYYKKLRYHYRLLFWFIITSVIIIEVLGHGKMKQISEIYFFTGMAYFLRECPTIAAGRLKFYTRFSAMAVMAVTSIILIMSCRYVELEIDSSNIREKSHPYMIFNLDDSVLQHLPEGVGFSAAVFSGYISQGYYGLSLSLQLPFQWTYFVGNSYTANLLCRKYLDIDVPRNYPERLADSTEWGESKWSSGFAWFFGDFTPIGTLFFLAIIGYVFSRSWHGAFYERDPVSAVFLSILGMGLLFLPANNQLFIAPGSAFATIFFAGLWLARVPFYRGVDGRE